MNLIYAFVFTIEVFVFGYLLAETVSDFINTTQEEEE